MSYVFPIGSVLPFYGTWVDNITMVGWYKCNGANGTPNMINSFSYGSSTTGWHGGTNTKTNISHYHGGISNRTAHNHGGTTGTSNPSTHSHSFLPWVYATGGAYGLGLSQINSYSSNYTLYNSEGGHTHSGTMTSSGGHGHTTNSSGSSGSNKNMPKYKKCIPIMRVS